MSNYGDTPGEPPQNPYGQQGPPGEPSYGQPPQGQPASNPYGQPYGAAGGDGGGQSPYGQAGGSQFSVGEAFGYGWKKFQANLGPILIAALVMFAVVVTIQILQRIIGGGDTIEFDPESGTFERDSGLFGGSFIASMFFSALSFLAQLVIQAGIVKGALDLTRGKPISIGSMFAGINWAQVVVASLIIAVVTIVGIIACVLPGLAWLFLTSFTLHFMIDKDLDAISAVRASITFVMANAGTLFVFFLACIAAYIVGALLCGVGLLVAIPVVVIATAYAYRTLQGEQVAA